MTKEEDQALRSLVTAIQYNDVYPNPGHQQSTTITMTPFERRALKAALMRTISDNACAPFDLSTVVGPGPVRSNRFHVAVVLMLCGFLIGVATTQLLHYLERVGATP